MRCYESELINSNLSVYTIDKLLSLNTYSKEILLLTILFSSIPQSRTFSPNLSENKFDNNSKITNTIISIVVLIEALKKANILGIKRKVIKSSNLGYFYSNILIL